MSNQNKTINWQAAEFKHYPKNVGWYVTLISIFVLIIGFFIVVESDIFAAVCLGIICILIIIFSRQIPQTVEIELDNRGIKFGGLFYPYKQIKYFWIVDNQRHRTLNFHTSAFINNVLIIELEDQDPEQVRVYLNQYLPEHHETEETPIQKIMHRFKF